MKFITIKKNDKIELKYNRDYFYAMIIKNYKNSPAERYCKKIHILDLLFENDKAWKCSLCNHVSDRSGNVIIIKIFPNDIKYMFKDLCKHCLNKYMKILDKIEGEINKDVF